MQSESRYIHVAGRPTLIEKGKDASQFSNVVRCHSPRPTAIVECLEASVLERQNHIGSRTRSRNMCLEEEVHRHGMVNNILRKSVFKTLEDKLSRVFGEWRA